MTMPVMEPDLDAMVLQSWARAIDEGPFSSLCWGERITYSNPDNLTLLGALAAWTKRVRLPPNSHRAPAGAGERRKADQLPLIRPFLSPACRNRLVRPGS